MDRQKPIKTMELIFTIGPSGSGKTTWCETHLQAHPGYICLNRDSLRLAITKQLKGYYDRPDLNDLEAIVSDMAYHLIKKAKIQGYSLLIDNTNLKLDYIKRIVDDAGEGVTWQYKLFDCRPEIAKTRVLLRDHQDIEFPPFEKVAYIDRQHQQYLNIKNILLTQYKANNYDTP